MKKIVSVLVGLFLSLNLFSQSLEREIVVNNHTNTEYLGLYYVEFAPMDDVYISKYGDVKSSDYKYKYFEVKSNSEFNKTFTKNFNVKFYVMKDSIFTEVLKFKLDCSKVTIDLYDNYYQIIYKRYNGEVREQRQYLSKRYE